MNSGLLAYLPFRDEFTALSPDKFPPEYIDGQVATGAWRCWGDEAAAILVELKEYPSGLKEVHGLAAAGELARIVDLIEVAESWGRQMGCAEASIESRPAWVKILPEYEVDQVRIVKGLM